MVSVSRLLTVDRDFQLLLEGHRSVSVSASDADGCKEQRHETERLPICPSVLIRSEAEVQSPSSETDFAVSSDAAEISGHGPVAAIDAIRMKRGNAAHTARYYEAEPNGLQEMRTHKRPCACVGGAQPVHGADSL